MRKLLAWVRAWGFLGAIVWPGAGVAADRAPDDLAEFITIREGTLPIVVTAPHGGRLPFAGFAERVDRGAKRFVTQPDQNSAEVAESLAAEIEKRLGGRPYLIVARFERKYIDANRPREHAFDDEQAAPYYDAYHAALAKACREVQEKWHGGLLLDIHGQSAHPDHVLRGTNNGETVELLRKRHGDEAFLGPDSLFGLLDKAGYHTKPEPGSTTREVPEFDGGYTVETYGSHRAGGIDALQVEFGRSFRVPKSMAEKSGRDLAVAVEKFCEKYYPGTKKKA